VRALRNCVKETYRVSSSVFPSLEFYLEPEERYWLSSQPSPYYKTLLRSLRLGLTPEFPQSLHTTIPHPSPTYPGSAELPPMNP
jgi:hypothetical protein